VICAQTAAIFVTTAETSALTGATYIGIADDADRIAEERFSAA
jgi:hypothetical protein